MTFEVTFNFGGVVKSVEQCCQRLFFYSDSNPLKLCLCNTKNGMIINENSIELHLNKIQHKTLFSFEPLFVEQIIQNKCTLRSLLFFLTNLLIKYLLFTKRLQPLA